MAQTLSQEDRERLRAGLERKYPKQIDKDVKNPADLTKSELYEKAQELEIEGRSQMDKDDLVQAVESAESGETEEE